MFRNGLYAENSGNLDRYSLYHRVSTAGKRKYGRDVQATFAISRRFFALKYAKLLNNPCVLLGIIVCSNNTGISSFHSCDLQHSACPHFGAKGTQSTSL